MINPHGLFPQQFIEFIPSTLSEFFDLHTYSNHPQAWSIAENTEISLLVSYFDASKEGLAALVNGLRVMHPDLIHLMIADEITIEELLPIINISSRIRVINSQDLERELSRSGADCYSLYLAGTRKDRQIQALQEESKQFEEMLKQSFEL